MPFGYGSIVTSTALHKEYDHYAEQVLSKYLKREPKTARRERTKYSVLEQTPTKEEYIKLKQEKFKTTVGALVADAFSDIQSLADEMQEAFDNMPEGLQQGDVGTRREEAASALSSIDEVEVPEEVSDIEVVYYPSLDTSSRSKRAAEAAFQLRAAAEAIREFIDNFNSQLGDDEEENPCEVDSSVADELESAADDLEGVEFPGMYS